MPRECARSARSQDHRLKPPRSRSALRRLPALLALLCIGLLGGCTNDNRPGPLVVYCAHDSLYADEILQKFTEQTGIQVSPRYDTEATKSLGLVQQLVREKDNPRCDVFWNNELLGTLHLKHQGVLQSYRGSGFDRIPEIYRDAEAYWAGFAARFRVYIVNTNEMQATADAIDEAWKGDLSETAIAKPLYGTTLTQYCVYWHLWGTDKLKSWNADLLKRGIRVVTGNATVKNLVAQGVCHWGLTDTDDFFLAVDDGSPVAMVPVTLENQQTICIPNTVAIIEGTQHRDEARKLVDFLLSAETELALANSKSRQVPLGPVDEQRLPDDVTQLLPWVERGYDLRVLNDARNQCLAWLQGEYGQ